MATRATTSKRRSRPLRVERDDKLLFITSRTVEERFWLHPLLSCAAKPCNRHARRAVAALGRDQRKRYARLAAEANARSGPYARKLTGDVVQRIAEGLVGAALALVQKAYGFKLYAFVAMSNHFHMVIQTQGMNAAAILRDFKSSVSKRINSITGRRGPLWSRRADIQPVLDDAAGSGRVAYCVDNPRKAHTVKDPEQWPGLNLCFGLNDSDELTFEHFDNDAWVAAGRPEDLSPFFIPVTLTLSPLPACEGRDREGYAADVRRWVADRVREEEASTGGRSSRQQDVVGLEKILDANFDQRPKQPKMTRRPYCFGSPQHCAAHYEEMGALHAVYADHSERYRSGERHVRFPPGTYPPPVMAVAA